MLFLNDYPSPVYTGWFKDLFYGFNDLVKEDMNKEEIEKLVAEDMTEQEIEKKSAEVQEKIAKTERTKGRKRSRIRC